MSEAPDDSDDIVAHTDGSGNTTSSHAGWAFNIVHAGRIICRFGFRAGASNNEAELTAVVRVLQFVRPSKHPLVIYTDSEYVRGAANEWCDNWERQGWMTGTGKPVSNVELMQEMMKLLRWQRSFRRVTIHWVRGHDGNKHNEMADAVAKSARLSQTTNWLVPTHLPAWANPVLMQQANPTIKAITARVRRRIGPPPEPNARETIISPCGKYRYILWREWDPSKPHAVFVGLNPSTADGEKDDATIRRCVAFAKRWGYGALCMVNLFAFRATLPGHMLAAEEPIGLDNDKWLLQAVEGAGVVVAAWGPPGVHMKRDRAVMQLLEGKLSSLQLSKHGFPGHPLYLKADLTPVPFNPLQQVAENCPNCGAQSIGGICQNYGCEGDFHGRNTIGGASVLSV